MIILEFIANHIFPIILFGVAVYVWLWSRHVRQEKVQVDRDAIDLEAQKIAFKVNSDPLDKLIADSNSVHSTDGPTEVFKTPGDPSKAK